MMTLDYTGPEINSRENHNNRHIGDISAVYIEHCILLTNKSLQIRKCLTLVHES